MRIKRWLACLAAAATAVSLAACGSNGDQSGGSSSDAFKDATNPALEPVKVGLIVAVGTPGSAVPSAVSALTAAVRGVNARGGFDGHRVEMVFCNDKTDPNETATCARKMVDEKVVAITGGASLHDSVSQPILAKAGIPIIGVNAFSSTLFNAENVYLPQITGLMSYQAALGYAVRNDLLPMAVAMSDNPAGRTFADRLEGKLKELSGGKGFAEKVPVATDTADYGPAAGVINKSGAKSLLMVISAPQQQGLMRALEGQGSDVAAFFSAPSSTLKQIRDRGKLADRMVFAQSYPGFGHPTMGRYREEMAAQATTGDKDAELDNVTPLGADAWFALQAVEQVTRGLATITAETVTKALESAKNIDFGGAVAPWTPSSPGPQGLSRMSNTCPWFVGFEDGELRPLSVEPVCMAKIEAGDFVAKVPPAVQAAAGS